MRIPNYYLLELISSYGSFVMEDGLEMHKDVSENCLIGNYSFLGGEDSIEEDSQG